LDIPGEPAPSLHPHPSEQELPSYYGPVRQRAPRPVLNASVSASARSLSRPWGPCDPGACFDARLLTFHARAADQDHAASTPDTAWPATRAAARLIPKTNPLLGFDVVSTGFDASNDDARPEHPPGPDDSGTSSWSPPDEIEPRLLPGRSPRRSSANAAPGRFDARPRRADAGGPAILHLSHSTAVSETAAYISLLQRS
jgi:hypothetical protein